MLPLLLILFVGAGIRPYEPGFPISTISSLPSNTVILMETQWYEFNQKTGMYDELPDADWAYSYIIFASPKNNWKTILEKYATIAQIQKEGVKNNLLFTASMSTYYLFEVSADIPAHALKDGRSYGVRINFYRGKESNPTIVSMADKDIQDLKSGVEYAKGITKQTLDIIMNDAKTNLVFKKRISLLKSLVILSFICKLVVPGLAYFYLNQDLRSYYVKTKIGPN